VTISIPSFNYGRFIGRTIESVLAQDYADYEVLVIDDASKDNSAEVVAQYRDPRIQYIQNTSNMGQFATINKALHLGQGRYFINLASDDVWYPGLLRRAVSLLDAYPNLAAVHTAEYCIDSDDRKLTINTAAYPAYAQGAQALQAFFRGGWHFSFSSCVMRRSVALRCGGFDREFGEFADSAMFVRLCGSGDIAFQHDCLIGYRLHGTSVSDNMFVRADDWFRQQRQFIDRIFAWDEWAHPSYASLRDEAVEELAKLMVRRAHLVRLAAGRRQVWEIVRHAWSMSPRAVVTPHLWTRALLSWLLPEHILRNLQRRKRNRVLAMANG
jgi:glycosyltransferase involved in cell wall biosynthesis